MKYRKVSFLFFSILCIFLSGVFGQTQKIADSLAKIYKQNTKTGAAKMVLLADLSFNEMRDLKKGLWYAEELITLSEQSGDYGNMRIGYYLKGTKKRQLGNLDEALDAYIKSIELAKQLKYVKGEGEAYGAMADIYSEANNYPNALQYYRKAIFTLRMPPVDSISLASVLLNTGDVFLRSRMYDSALLYSAEAKDIFEKFKYQSGKAYSLGNIGMVYANTGKTDLAEKNILEAVEILQETQDYYPICAYFISLADMYLTKGDIQTAFDYNLKSLNLAEQYQLKQQVADASLKLSELYEKTGNLPAAFKYYKTHIENRDSVNNIESVRKMADLRTDFEVSQKQLEVNFLNQQKQNQKSLVFSLGIILFLTTIILIILLRNNQNKQKAYTILNLQKQETELQKAKAEDAYTELQLTQKQLIQSAKMASLGELTAGIAHEIKNPLNFVTNFAEVNIELLGDLKEEILNKLSPLDKSEADLIVTDLEDNMKKIISHGKRADSIVKGMLQHSRVSTGKKEPTDINALAGEYLRLSQHGLSGKDKLLASFKTDFDEALSTHETGPDRVLVVPQDIGNVLLNLYNNAFYSVIKKKNEGPEGYEPLVTVSTKKIGNTVRLSVKDNGSGISQNILDKIFQPFFTTKPTGQGTGLGLSLSYDIIKAHGGELKVETKEGEFAEFIIMLPLDNKKDTEK